MTTCGSFPAGMAKHDKRGDLMTKRKGAGGAILILPVLLLLIAVILLLTRSARRERMQEAASAAAGVDYIRALELMDPGEVESQIKAIRAQELAAMRQQRLDDLASGAIDVWSLFEDYVIIGDSRALGFSYYGHLPEDRVIAELGATILGVEEKLDMIRPLNPATIYLAFGANDLNTYIWTDGPSYAARYRELVELLQREFPDAVIVVNSILPIHEPSYSKESIYQKVPEFNQSLRQMCSETGAVFVDNDALSEAQSGLYEGDGIHFMSAFYPHWGANMIEAFLESGEGDDLT